MMDKNMRQKKKKTKEIKWVSYVAAMVLIGSLVAFFIVKVKGLQEQNDYVNLKEEVVSANNSAYSESVDVVEIDTDTDTVAAKADTSTVVAETEAIQKEAFWYSPYAKEPDQEIDFEKLCAENPDIYAWITIPGTEIDYPIAHCDKDNAIYLNQDMYGNKSAAGMIFTDTYNTNDFSDPMTLVYGHNMKNGSMFAGLHAFKDSQFFEENDLIKIYMGDAELDYRIFACYISKNEQILALNDFHDSLVFNRYLEGLSEIRDFSANFRQDVPVTFSDHVITLVTCVGQDDKRLFVQAVLEGQGNDGE